MKTNQVMVRPMGSYKVEQRTQDGFFNATSLLKQWNDGHADKERQLDNFWKSTHLTELMSEIAKNELKFESVEFTDLKKALSKTVRGNNGGTWMHPILFIKFAMYLNPSFEYQVIKFVSDQMIDYRKQAGDAYKALSSAVSKIVDDKSKLKDSLALVGKALNYISFNTHSPEQRNNHGTVKEQQELLYNEKYFADLIDQGFIKCFDDLIKAMRKKWVERWLPKPSLP